jgi:ribosomal protein L12E/L44/L45/RPP1/RPP2
MKTKYIEVTASLSEDSIKALLSENDLEQSDINIATLIGLLRNKDTAEALNEDLKSVIQDACVSVLDSHGEQFDGSDVASDEDPDDDNYDDNDSYDDSYNDSYDDSYDDSEDDEGYF